MNAKFPTPQESESASFHTGSINFTDPPLQAVPAGAGPLHTPEMPTGMHRAEDRAASAQVAMGTQEVDILIANSNTIDKRTKELLQQHKPLLYRLFPGKMQRMLADMERHEVKSAMEFRARLYAVATQYQLESVTEVYQAKLTLLKLYGQSRVITFALSQMLELKAEIDYRQRIFIELMKGKYAYLATLTNLPLLAQRYEAEIEREFGEFFTFVNSQAAKFEQKANETLQRFY
jgi:hypothetical protein